MTHGDDFVPRGLSRDGEERQCGLGVIHWPAALRQRVGKLRLSIVLDAPIVGHFSAVMAEGKQQPLQSNIGSVHR